LIFNLSASLPKLSETLADKRTCGTTQSLERYLELKDNTAEEICEATIEMIELTKNPRSRKDYDIVNYPENPMQHKLDSIRKQNKVVGRLPLARSFLRRHEELLQ
jgi:hypothetical protein